MSTCFGSTFHTLSFRMVASRKPYSLYFVMSFFLSSDQRGYSLVIDRSSNATGIIYGSPKVDISNEVLQKLGYSYQ